MAPRCQGRGLNPQLMKLLSLQPAHSLLCAGFVTRACMATQAGKLV